MRSSLSGKWFTLVEMLIVIVIFMILSMLLLPSLNRARYKVTTISCANKLKQIGLASSMYSSDFSDWIVPAKVIPDENITLWYYSLLDYGDLKYYTSANTQKCSFACPAETIRIVNTGYAYTHYSINVFLSGCRLWGTYACYWRKQVHSFAPSQTIFVGDVFMYGTLLYYVEYFGYRHGNGGEKRKFSQANTDANINPASSGSSNILFLDGHVNSMGYSELINVKDDHYTDTTYRDKALFRGFDRTAGVKNQ